MGFVYNDKEEPLHTTLTGSNAQLDEIINTQKTMINVMQSDKLIFGIHWDKTSTVTRIDAAEGLVANAGVDGQLVRNDFDKMPIFGEIHEVEDAYGNKFMRYPKFYIQKTGGKSHLIKRVSKTRYPGFYLPWWFWDFKNNKELEYADFGKHKGSVGADGKLESKFGTQPTINKNIVEFRTHAQNNNNVVAVLTGYQQLDAHAYDVLTTLFQIEFAALNSQSIMQGLTTGAYSDSHTSTLTEAGVNRVVVANSTADAFVIGQSISIGTARGSMSVVYGRTVTSINVVDAANKEIVFDGDPLNITVGNVVWSSGWRSGFSADIAASSGSIGDNTSGKYPCMYRGVESPWGDLWQFVDGVNINDNQAWIAKNADEYASNVFASPYEKLSYINSNANGYPVALGLDNKYPFTEFPVTLGGSPSTYYGDYYYQTSGQRIALVGGYLNNGSNAGLSFWYLSGSSGHANWDICARLLKKAS